MIGIACRFATANNAQEFWQMLLEGRNGVGTVPVGRWGDDRIPPTLERPEDCKDVQAGFLRLPIDEGDYKFFGMSRTEFQFTDPQQRMLLELCWEALEDAGINPQKLRGSATGIFTGISLTEYKDLLVRLGFFADDIIRPYLGSSIAGTSAKISQFFGTVGPNVATESGMAQRVVTIFENLQEFFPHFFSLFILHDCNRACYGQLKKWDFRLGPRLLRGCLRPTLFQKHFGSRTLPRWEV